MGVRSEVREWAQGYNRTPARKRLSRTFDDAKPSASALHAARTVIEADDVLPSLDTMLGIRCVPGP